VCRVLEGEGVAEMVSNAGASGSGWSATRRAGSVTATGCRQIPSAVMVGFGLEGVDAHRLTVLGVSLFGHGSDQSVYRVDAQRVEQGVQAGGGVDLVLTQGGGYSYREPEVACLRDASESRGMASRVAVVVVQRRAGRVKAHLKGDPLARHGFERRATGALWKVIALVSTVTGSRRASSVINSPI